MADITDKLDSANTLPKVKNKVTWKEFSIGCSIGAALVSALLGLGYVGVSSVINGYRNARTQNESRLASSNEPIYLTVTDAVYREHMMPQGEFHGALLKSSGELEGVIAGSYVITGKTSDGKTLCIDVIGSAQKLRLLDGLIKQGTKIEFPRGNFTRDDYGTFRDLKDETYFSTGINRGAKSASRITVQN